MLLIKTLNLFNPNSPHCYLPSLQRRAPLSTTSHMQLLSTHMWLVQIQMCCKYEAQPKGEDVEKRGP